MDQCCGCLLSTVSYQQGKANLRRLSSIISGCLNSVLSTRRSQAPQAWQCQGWLSLLNSILPSPACSAVSCMRGVVSSQQRPVNKEKPSPAGLAVYCVRPVSATRCAATRHGMPPVSAAHGPPARRMTRRQRHFATLPRGQSWRACGGTQK